MLIERIQRRFTRMIPSVRNLPYEVRLKKTGFMVIRRQTCQSWSYRGLQNCTWLIFSQVWYFFFEFLSCSWTRGHSLKLKKNRVRTDLRQHFFSNVLLISGANLITTQSVHHRWFASNVIWRNCIKMSHFIDCCSPFDSRGWASLPHGEASSGKLSIRCVEWGQTTQKPSTN